MKFSEKSECPDIFLNYRGYRDCSKILNQGTLNVAVITSNESYNWC